MVALLLNVRISSNLKFIHLKTIRIIQLSVKTNFPGQDKEVEQVTFHFLLTRAYSATK